MTNDKLIFVGWFSAGVDSAVACKLALDKGLPVVLYYIETGASHPDSIRFLHDCENWYGQKINIVQSRRYSSPFDCVVKEKMIGAVKICTDKLKRSFYNSVAKEWEQKGYKVINIIGYDYTPHEVNVRAFNYVGSAEERAIRLKLERGMNHYFPLIEEKFDKQRCKNVLAAAGIKEPEMYSLGFKHNNCIGCIKAGKAYWALIRKLFPDEFAKWAKLERKQGAAILKKAVGKNEEGKNIYGPDYLDEIPADYPAHDKDPFACDGFFCTTAEHQAREFAIKGDISLLYCKEAKQ